MIILEKIVVDQNDKDQVATHEDKRKHNTTQEISNVEDAFYVSGAKNIILNNKGTT